ncbi:MAG TPA: tetratricopeptide repeat protein [bacterium]|nr:tetratricopeptide repeat protein [bacterium]
MSKSIRPVRTYLSALAALALAASAYGAKDDLKIQREANELFLQGVAEYEKDDFPAAIEKFEKCLAKDPTNAHAQFNVGVSYNDLGETEKALEAYRKTLAVDPEYPDAYFNMGRIYHLRKDFVEAATYYEKALQEDPYAPDVLYNYAHALMESGRAAEAIEEWNRYLTIAEALPEEAKWVERAKEFLATLEEIEGGTPGEEDE